MAPCKSILNHVQNYSDVKLTTVSVQMHCECCLNITYTIIGEQGWRGIVLCKNLACNYNASSLLE